MSSTEHISEQININNGSATVGTDSLNTQGQDGSILETNKLSDEIIIPPNFIKSNSANTESG